MDLPADFVDALSQAVPASDLVWDRETVAKRSKDYYWFSPKLERELKSASADVIYRVKNLDTLRSVIALAYQHSIPIHLRGGATGNFGQAVPLCGGLLIDFTAFNQITGLEGSLLRAQAGTRCRAIEDHARQNGLEMQCYPSTWAKATIAGFAIGGSGGIGGMRHGLLQQNKMIEGLTVMTVEANPQTLHLSGEDALDLIHSFGAVALVVEVAIRLAPIERWEQVVVSSPDFESLFGYAVELANDRSVPMRTMGFLENPLPSYCAPIRSSLPDQEHCLLIEIASSGLDALTTLSQERGYSIPLHIPHAEPRRSPMLSDFVQGHSLLWAMKADERLASISVFLSTEGWRSELAAIRPLLGADCFIQADFHRSAEQLFMQSSLLFSYEGEAHLEECLAALTEMGVLRFNSHDPYIGSKLNPERMAAKRALKARFDPAGLLSPGRFG